MYKTNDIVQNVQNPYSKNLIIGNNTATLKVSHFTPHTSYLLLPVFHFPYTV